MIIQRAIADAKWILDKVGIFTFYFNTIRNRYPLRCLILFLIYSIPRRSEVHKPQGCPPVLHSVVLRLTEVVVVEAQFLCLTLECSVCYLFALSSLVNGY